MKQLLLALTTSLILSSCNTSIGLWRDTKWAANQGAEKIRGISSKQNSSNSSYNANNQGNYQEPIY